MQIQYHHVSDTKIAEVLSGNIIINNAGDGLDLMGNLYYQGFDSIILHRENISPEFFDLKTGMAGEILQKFSNYRMRLAIVGDFSSYQHKSLQDFILESNKRGHVSFVGSLDEAIEKLSHP